MRPFIALAMIVAAGGCSYQRPPARTVATHPSAAGIDAPRAHGSGAYYLTRVGPDCPRQVRGFQLRGRDRVGFERDAVGRLYAVAGRRHLPLAEGEYRWEYCRPHPLEPLERFSWGVVLLAAIPLAAVLTLLGHEVPVP